MQMQQTFRGVEQEEERTLNFHGVEVSSQYRLKNINLCSSMVWAQVVVPTYKRPSRIELVIGIKADAGDTTLVVQNERVAQAYLYTLTVPVEWDGDIPHTRQRGRDNVDVIRLLPNGRFLNFGVGLVTHRSHFFITIQKVYAGHVVRTRQGLDFVPTDGIHAYPGATYSGIWSTIAEELETVAQDEDATRQRSRVKIGQWDPPEVPELSGWRRGVVLYYNLITRTGRIKDVDTDEVFYVYWRQILTEDTSALPVLHPMMGVHYRPNDQPTREGQLRSVKSIKPA
jgi:hypothetical protein